MDICAKIETATKHKVDKVDAVFVKLDEDNTREFERNPFALSKEHPDKKNEKE
jgi:hypothetical protein